MVYGFTAGDEVDRVWTLSLSFLIPQYDIMAIPMPLSSVTS